MAKMKILMINGSPRANGNTAVAFEEMEKIFHKNGIETEIVRVGSKDIRGCISCRYCFEYHRCVFDDIVNELAVKFEECDGMVIGSPVYHAGLNGTLVSLLNRLFYSTHFDKTMKVGAAVVALRRGGGASAFDQINKFFTVYGMPVASGQYWNSVHGREEGECVEDFEGMQSVRTLAENMSFLVKSIALGKEKFGLPEKEERIMTNFIR